MFSVLYIHGLPASKRDYYILLMGKEAYTVAVPSLKSKLLFGIFNPILYKNKFCLGSLKFYDNILFYTNVVIKTENLNIYC